MPPPSKSIEARKLILRAVKGLSLEVNGYSLSDLPEDLCSLVKALEAARLGSPIIHVVESGTAMRFMLAYLSATTRHCVRIEGSGRQHERPIAPLVDALRSLGAHIEYQEIEGYPPLLIYPARLSAKKIWLDASNSSQYFSALLLIAALFDENGYTIEEKSATISAPYVEMTINCMRDAGYYWQKQGKVYSYMADFAEPNACVHHTEGDWTAASYAYLVQCLAQCSGEDQSREHTLLLEGLSLPSWQGDAQALGLVFSSLGVQTKYDDTAGIELINYSGVSQECSPLRLNCSDVPDLVPTFVAACLSRGQCFRFEGVSHLRIKECDRLEALRRECAKMGYLLSLTESTVSWNGERAEQIFTKPVELNSHGDHRIAMALAPLAAMVCPYGVIVDSERVVRKSFPAYWEVLRGLGYNIRELD